MKINHLLFGLGLISAGAQAQQAPGIQNLPVAQRDYSKVTGNEYGSLTELTNGASHLLTRRPNTVGSPYADDRWLPARLTLTNTAPLAPILLKYNVLEHGLVMRRPAPVQDSVALDDHRVASFVLMEPASALGPGRERLFRRFLEGPPARQGDYVEVLHEGRYTLLKHHEKHIKKESFQGMYSNGAPTDEIEDISEYYLRAPEGALTPVKLTLKSLQNAAPPLADALKTAAATQKPRTEAAWATVLHAADPAAK
ncbi:hypothetical protein [Hymenobacter ruricola]|uniref:Uncharacterized protein n=1 Tax=Hymenobacter ruricola TaxID=2791023 RepID=A0ABS0I640_9BACT|nr:hypothetical protein [Hymenobacter ruricola]MBF9222395.1 hypothetical protein [Hymenobacter ruricola]